MDGSDCCLVLWNCCGVWERSPKEDSERTVDVVVEWSSQLREGWNVHALRGGIVAERQLMLNTEPDLCWRLVFDDFEGNRQNENFYYGFVASDSFVEFETYQYQLITDEVYPKQPIPWCVDELD